MKKLLVLALAALLLLPVLPAYAADRTTFSIEEKDYYDITETIPLTINSGDGYTGADVLVDNKVVTSLEGNGAGENTYNLSLSGVAYLGEVKLSINANYDSDDYDTFSKDIFITKLGDESSYLSEDFSSYSSGTSMGSVYGVVNSGASFSKYTYGGGNVAIKTTLPGKVAASAPYIMKDGLNIPAGSLIQIDFDVYYSTADCYVQIETRAMSGTPKDGSTSMYLIPVFGTGVKIAGGSTYSSETWYNCRVVMNTITKGLDIYVKGGDFADYTLQKSYPNYVSSGLKQIRPNILCGSTSGGFAVLDNISVSAKSRTPQWYAKASFAAADDSALTDKTAAIDGGKIKLAFSKDMGTIAEGGIKIVNASKDEIPSAATYNSETFTYTIVPSQKLCFNSNYSVVFQDGLLAGDGSGALSGAAIDFTTEKYQLSVTEVAEISGGINVSLSNAASVAGEAIAVCAYNADGAMTEFNMVAISADGSEDVLLPNASATDKIVIYLVDSSDGKLLYQIFEK